jgi:uncharacterized Zn finger protein
MLKTRNLKDLQAKARRLKTTVIDAHTVLVQSQSSPNHVISVRSRRNGAIEARCTCAWAQHGGSACSHILAALSALAARQNRKLSFWMTPEEAQRQRKHVLQVIGENGGRIWLTSRSGMRQAA